jgi:hypothetical protein
MPNKGNETCHIFVNWIPPLQIKTEEKQRNFFFSGFKEINEIYRFLDRKESTKTRKMFGKLRSIILNKGMIIQ